MRRGTLLMLAFGLIVSGTTTVVGDIPHKLNVQGRLTNASGEPLPPGPKIFIFKIYNSPTGGAEIWPGIAGQEEQAVETDDQGLWTAPVGAVVPIPSDVFLEPPIWLEIAVNADGTWDTLPRLQLISGPFANHSQLSDEALLSFQAAPFSVGSEAILDGTIGFVDIGQNEASPGQVMKWTGADWIAADDDIGTGNDEDWYRVGGVLFSGQEWGLARDGSVLHGSFDSTHVNWGVACTTGTAGFNDWYVTVGGGVNNAAKGAGATVAGGFKNYTYGSGATVGGGITNRAIGTDATVAGGGTNTANGTNAAVAGGNLNEATGDFSFVGGGINNHAADTQSFVGGGEGNRASRTGATVVGGGYNHARGSYSTVCGGGSASAVDSNAASGEGSAIGGGIQNLTTGMYSRVGGGDNNTASQWSATVAGGHINTADGLMATVGGGSSNFAVGNYATVSGGVANEARAGQATVGGGNDNDATASSATISGGYLNKATAYYASIGGGSDNQADGRYSAIGGGDTDTASGDWSCIPGGRHNVATGDYSFAAGRRAKALHHGSFVWADSTDADFASTIANEYAVSAANGLRVITDNALYGSYFDNETGHGDGVRSYANVSKGIGWGAIFAVNSGTSAAIYASATTAGYFNGNVTVTGTLSKGGGSFKIDHPLDPENKYLYHSFVESPDMKNVYDGVVTLDANGESWVQLPEWCEALNRDFRYQLTCVGGYAPVYIAEKIRGNRFRIAGGTAGLEVCWQVTGIRQDAFANANRIPVEEMKPAAERGYYLHPVAFGQPKTRGMNAAAERKKALNTVVGSRDE